jgi:hypothetical protein
MFNGVKQVYGWGGKMFPAGRGSHAGDLHPEPKDDVR